LLALELYREDKVSLGRAAELCQTPLAAFMDFAAQHSVAPLRYSHQDLEGERRWVASP
jgi:predicted HTH domain antitoxin